MSLIGNPGNIPLQLFFIPFWNFVRSCQLLRWVALLKPRAVPSLEWYLNTLLPFQMFWSIMSCMPLLKINSCLNWMTVYIMFESVFLSSLFHSMGKTVISWSVKIVTKIFFSIMSAMPSLCFRLVSECVTTRIGVFLLMAWVVNRTPELTQYQLPLTDLVLGYIIYTDLLFHSSGFSSWAQALFQGLSARFH